MIEIDRPLESTGPGVRSATIRLGGMWHDLLVFEPGLTLEIEPRRLRNVDLAEAPRHMTMPGSSWLTETFTLYLDLACGTILEPDEELVLAALDRLAYEHPATYPAVILRAADVPYTEIAARLGCALATVRSHVRRGKLYLEDFYGLLHQSAVLRQIP